MARYVTTVRTTRSPEDAFAYVADLRNFAEWDPGVVAAEQVEGQGIGSDAAYEVTVKNPGRDITLRYRTVEIDVGDICTVGVGHCHPRVQAALAKQAAEVWHTSACWVPAS